MDDSNWTDYISHACGLCGQSCEIERMGEQAIRIICLNGHEYRVSFDDNGMKWTRVDQNEETDGLGKRRRGDLARKVIVNLGL